MALNLLLLLAAASTASSLQSGPHPLRRRTNQPKAIHRLRGGHSTGGADWRFFVAGSISAALSHGYTTPIDVIKTRMQTKPELYNGSAILALRMIVESDGALFLLQGLVPTLIGYGLEGALKFGSYEMLKPLFAQLTRSAFFNCILASCVAGAIAAVVLCPAEEVRIRMVDDPDYAPSAAAALRRISREKGGAFGSLGGFPAMAAKQVPYTMGKQVSFDFLCTLAVDLLRRSGVPVALAGRLAPMLAALPAAVLAAVLSHPGDVLLTEFYKGGSGGEESSSLLESLRSVVRKRGVGGLLVGLQARLVHVIGIIWVQLIIYDSIKQGLGLPATGH